MIIALGRNRLNFLYVPHCKLWLMLIISSLTFSTNGYSQLIEGRPIAVPSTTFQEFQSRNSSTSHTVQCGVWAEKQLFHPRVFGGSAVKGPIPWQVGIRIKSGYSNQTKHYCGATIINELWIVSAAHCFEDLDITKYILRVGDWNNSVHARGKHEMEYEIENLILHPNYTGMETMDYDVALIKVRPINGQGIQFSADVAPACLPEPDLYQPHPGQLCLVSGWGRINGWKLPNILQSAKVPLISSEDCSIMKTSGIQITERMLCAGYDNGGVDTCQQDSGGPLVCLIKDKYVWYGITSFGEGCGEPNSPGVYANVTAMLDWMKRITGVQ